MAFFVQQPYFKFKSLGKSYHSNFCLAFHTVDKNLGKKFLQFFVKLKKKSRLFY